MLRCYGCGLPYADVGHADFLIPDEFWLKISPTLSGGGVLCVICILRRLDAAGLICQGQFTSGPCANHNPLPWKKTKKPNSKRLAGTRMVK